MDDKGSLFRISEIKSEWVSLRMIKRYNRKSSNTIKHKTKIFHKMFVTILEHIVIHKWGALCTPINMSMRM